MLNNNQHTIATVLKLMLINNQHAIATVLKLTLNNNQHTIATGAPWRWYADCCLTST
jgi:hypothetical protein